MWTYCLILPADEEGQWPTRTINIMRSPLLLSSSLSWQAGAYWGTDWQTGIHGQSDSVSTVLSHRPEGATIDSNHFFYVSQLQLLTNLCILLPFESLLSFSLLWIRLLLFWCFPWVEYCSSWPPAPLSIWNRKNKLKFANRIRNLPNTKHQKPVIWQAADGFFKSVESLLGQDRDEVLTGSQPAMVRVLMIYNSQWCYLTKRDILDPCWLSLTESGYLWTHLQYF